MEKPKRRKLASPHAKSLPLVVVIWEDAALGDSDAAPEHIGSGTVINHTAGWLLRRTKKEIQLVIDATPDENTVRWPYCIPTKLLKRPIIFMGITSGDLEWPITSTTASSPEQAPPSR